jgi:hypothetical protein
LRFFERRGERNQQPFGSGRCAPSSPAACVVVISNSRGSDVIAGAAAAAHRRGVQGAHQASLRARRQVLVEVAAFVGFEFVGERVSNLEGYESRSKRRLIQPDKARKPKKREDQVQSRNA